MIRKLLFCMLPLVLTLQGCASSPMSDSEVLAQAIELQNTGKYEQAIPLWSQLSEHGDDNATVTLALMYQTGTGVEKDYEKAMKLYLSVWDRNGDAMNNLGVMFRDGQGVTPNRKIAYGLFFATYMRSLGSMDTLIRAGRNFDRENVSLGREERDLAGCMTMSYIFAYVETKGRLSTVPEDLRASEDRPRMRDIDEDRILDISHQALCPMNS